MVLSAEFFRNLQIRTKAGDMQEIIMYVAANETIGAVKDYAGAATAAAPTLVFGVEVCLRMRLFCDADGDTPYPVDRLNDLVSWRFGMDGDYDGSTVCKIMADNDRITVENVYVEARDQKYAEIVIPISAMNNIELIDYLGTKESVKLNAELVGYDANAKPTFVLQIFGFVVRNRIIGDDMEPEQIKADYLNAEQVQALIAAGLALEFSSDGIDWHIEQDAEDRYLRFRSVVSSNAAWSSAIKLAEGQAGVSSYTYIAYGADAFGADFSLTPNEALKYRAEIISKVELNPPKPVDFTNASWVKYIGDNGLPGIGDMKKEVYDTDGDGVVDIAAAVPWGGVLDKPSVFHPEAHQHMSIDLIDAARQKVRAGANLSTLYLDAPVLMNTTINQSDMLNLEFSSIVTSSGETYTGAPGDFFTWEYHVTCTQNIAKINTNMSKIDMPVALSLKDNIRTIHVFVIRAIYEISASNKLMLQVSYAYSYIGGIS